MNIYENTIESLSNSTSKRYLLSVIKNLVENNHVSIDAINAKDEKLGVVWNCLNAIAAKQDASKIVESLKRLGLYTESVVTEAMTPEERRKVIAAKAAERKANQELLLQIQLMSYDSLVKQILAKVPTAKWFKFKEGSTYKGKISYDSDDGIAELWFRNDGMVVCSSTGDNRRVRCADDEKIYNWIAEHPTAKPDNDKPITPDMIPLITKRLEDNYIADPFKKLNSQKVVGKQTVLTKHGFDSFDIWYRPSGEIFCKTPDGKFYTFTTVNRFGAFVKTVLATREDIK